MRKSIKLGLSAALALSVSTAAVFAENVKIAFIDPLSGGFAATGINGLHHSGLSACDPTGRLLTGQICT